MTESSFSQATGPFLRQMAADGRARLTIGSYRRQLVALAEGFGDVPLSQITADRLNVYLASPAVLLKAEGAPKRVSTINRTKSIIRSFFRWSERAGFIDQSPAAYMRSAVASRPLTSHMTRSELERFLGTIRHARHPLAIRDYAMFATLAYVGIRLSEVIGLQADDLDLRRRQLVLRRTKGGRMECRHLPACLSPVLSRFLHSKFRRAGSVPAPVFTGRRGSALSPRAVEYRFAFWIRRARIRRGLPVHSLRHTFGSFLYRATKDLVLVSRALGHGDIRSTERYAHLDDRRLIRAVNGMW